MIAFVLELENRVGAAADAADALAEKGINVVGLAGIGSGATGLLALATNDDIATRRALSSRGLKFREVELAVITLADAPGMFARACRALSDAGINIEAVFPVAGSDGRLTLAFATSDPARARTILKEAAPALKQ